MMTLVGCLIIGILVLVVGSRIHSHGYYQGWNACVDMLAPVTITITDGPTFGEDEPLGGGESLTLNDLKFPSELSNEGLKKLR